MRRWSAGILMFRRRGQHLEVFLVHPGGPFWQKKEIGAWSIPKGEYLDGEDELAAAKREFEEETGIKPGGKVIPLGIAGLRAGPRMNFSRAPASRPASRNRARIRLCSSSTWGSVVRG